ncbi:UNVERIFIED_ORG: alkanesulfonate monooxygenase SsuD/methylene tetrahydromethanopterin reductase-like flavin-dependent oxidoreductase (luciferase family) [Xanthobacter viscosus]|uniref:LLM class flavin-dependent oxidoreductase n=1 Tax=Xanthobacter autotrophicus TaxID=280 RepID=A0A6C1KS08_XANAU|nr:LLM class flavin-dependent oxidoreductase [Xanthobacter autotrophicus]TLX41383.1 LLM class flavin-dependent oxidoreductase [Xanthobacter autotrophicus]
MKVSYFQQVPYRHFPNDVGQHFESVVTPNYHELTEERHVVSAYRDALDECMHAARAGFDGIAITEHSQSSYDMIPNPDLLEAALAYATEVEGIQTAIYPVGRSLGKSREPLRVAEESAMLDCMSNGRLVCGFPVGLAYDANLNNGIPPAETRARFDENLDLVLRAWSERKPFAFNGKFSQYGAVNIWPRPVQASLPPVWVTGLGNPKTMEFCISRNFGFNYFGWFGYKLTGKRIFDRFASIAEQLGKKPNPFQIGFMQQIAIAETDAEAERIFGPHIEYFFRKGLGAIPLHRMMLPGGIDIRGLEFVLRDPSDFGMFEKFRTASLKELIEAGCVICGSPQTVRDQLVELGRNYGIGNLHAMLQFGSMPKELTMRTIDLFSSEVLPALKPIWENEYEHHWWPERLGGKPLPLEGQAEREVA